MSAFAVAAVGFSEGAALTVLLALVVVAVAASFAWGRLADVIGAVPTLLAVLGRLGGGPGAAGRLPRARAASWWPA